MRRQGTPIVRGMLAVGMLALLMLAAGGRRHRHDGPWGLPTAAAAPAEHPQTDAPTPPEDTAPSGAGVRGDGLAPGRMLAPLPPNADAVSEEVNRRVREALQEAGIEMHGHEPTKDLKIKIKRLHGHAKRSHGHGHDRDEYVVMGSSGRVEEDVTVSEAVVVGGSLEVLGRVEGEAVAVGGSLSLGPRAVVEGDATAVGGSVHLERGAVVEGSTTAIGGSVHVPDGAIVEGDQVSMGGSLGELIGTVVGMSVGGERDEHAWHVPGILFSVVFSLVQMLTLFVLAQLLLAFVPDRVERISVFMAARPGHSALAGLGLLVGFIPLCVLLAISVLGIPLIPLAFLTLLAVLVVGLTAFATWLGHRLPLLGTDKSQVMALVTGIVVLTLVNLVPIAGAMVVSAAGFVAGGATLLSRFGSAQVEPPPEALVPAPPAPSGDPGVP